MKCHVTLSLDVELVQELKRRGINISHEVNRFLGEVVKGEKLAESDELRIARQACVDAEERLKQIQEAEEQNRREQELDARLAGHREYYRKKRWESEDHRRQWLAEAALKLGISVDILKKKLEEGSRSSAAGEKEDEKRR